MYQIQGNLAFLVFTSKNSLDKVTMTIGFENKLFKVEPDSPIILR